MASTHKYATPESVTTLMDTALNSLGNGVVAVSGTVDNSAGLYKFADFEISTPTTGSGSDGTFDSLYLVESEDGTNFEDTAVSNYSFGSSGGTGFGDTAQLIGSVMIPKGSSSARKILAHIPIPATKFEVVYIPGRGAALAASGNTVKMIRYTEQDV